MDSTLKSHMGGNTGTDEIKDKPTGIVPPQNLFVCSAYFFALLFEKNANTVFHHLKVFKTEDGGLPTVLKINNQVLFAFRHYTLNIPDAEARRLYNRFVDTLIEGEHIYLQFNTSQEWIDKQVKTYMEVISLVNDGKEPLEAVDIVNQNHLEKMIDQAKEKIDAGKLTGEADKKNFSSLPE